MRKKTFLCVKMGVYKEWVITILSMHKYFTLTTFYQCLERNKMSKIIHVHYTLYDRLLITQLHIPPEFGKRGAQSQNFNPPF